ncbi:MAG: S-methyl-5-thioribose-1-phosphate isomerase [Clostridiales Family XIII bacterium]|jgi:methylthioribose-1-phosphate isomerase|nr:S-methyl-5-thioribose-1-phosphate isomerase [Clostridiales Family XIII bacterium]
MTKSVRYETVALDDDNGALVILDQTLLPNDVVYLNLTRQDQIFEAIRSLRVRGAPAIGVAAAIGVYLAAKSVQTDDYDEFYERFKNAKDYLAGSRPTAVNLFRALDRMEDVVKAQKGAPTAHIKEALRDETGLILEEDAAACRSIGEHGLALLRDGDGILTHCNAGYLAASKYGTALAPIHLGVERGYRFRVFVDETRPLLQGARLTAFELCASGAETTLICDNMASSVMKNGWVQAVFVGCDRLAANGDACNKIGTSGVAILAKHYGIPFYVCAPTSTIDIHCATGDGIPIEQRPPEEVTELWYTGRMAPAGVNVYNPAFDVTDCALITGVVTERGVLRPPYGESISDAMGTDMRQTGEKKASGALY